MVTRLYVSNFIKQVLTFYDNSNFSFFSNFSKKRELDFINCLFQLYYLHSHPDSPYSHTHSPHSHPIPRIPTLIPRIPILIPRIPTLIPRIPTLIIRIHTLIPRIPIILTLIPRIPIISLIPFPDSPFRFLQIAKTNLSDPLIGTRHRTNL